MTLQRGHRVQALGHLLPGHRLFGGQISAPATLADVQAIFADSTPGALYLPGELQDDQTATPSAAAGDGDPVGYFYDHSGNEEHGAASVASYRPTLTLENGKYHYATDGVDNHIRTPVLDLSGTQQCTIVLAARVNSFVNGQYLFSTDNNVGGGGTTGRTQLVTEVLSGGHYGFRTHLGGNTSRRVHDSAGGAPYLDFRNGSTSTVEAVFMVKIDYTKSDETELRMYQNGQEISRNRIVDTDAGSGNMSASEAFNFAGRGTTTNSNLKIYGCAVIGKLTSTEEDAQLNEYFGSLIDWPFSDTFDVFIVGGDSNAVGAGTPRDTEVDISDGYYWSPSNTGITSFNSIKAANNSFDGQSNGGPSIGPWTAFIREYMANNAGRIPLIVYAPWGGTGHSDGNWTVTTGTYYQRLLALTEMAMSSRLNNTLKGFLWMSGTNDTGFAGDPVYTGAEWSSAMQAMVAGFRSDIPGASSLPFVAGPLVPDFITDEGANAEDIQDAIDDLPNQITNCAVVDPTGLSLPSQNAVIEPHHFNAAAQRVLGPEFYDAWAGLAA